MTRSDLSPSHRALPALLLAASLLAAAVPAAVEAAGADREDGPAGTEELEPAPPAGPSLQTSARIWVGPQGAQLRTDTPFHPGAARAGVGEDTGSLEAVLRARRAGLTAELDLRGEDRRGDRDEASARLTELYQELDGRLGHFTLGKKVTSWDVAQAYRPLDVVQQERRRAFVPFALEGIPQLTWERFGEAWALSLLWVNPLQGRRNLPVHDEAGAARLFLRAGGADLYAVLRFAGRTGLQAGAGAVVVLGDALELHASARWQRRGTRLGLPPPGQDGAPLSAASLPLLPVHDAVTAVIGFTLTPGHDLTLLGEAWYDPEGDGPGTWRARRRLATAQRALLDAGAPRSAVEGSLAHGLVAFDRTSLLRRNLYLRVWQRWGRFEPVLDLLFTPDDRGLVTTAAVSWQGERLRAEGGLRLLGGPPSSAYRLSPIRALFYAAARWSL